MVSYTYEVKNLQTKSNNNDSKYTYKTNEVDTQLYIFEVLLKDSTGKVHSIRKIKKSNQGTLIDIDDTLQYELMQKVKITVINVNKAQEPIILRGNIDHKTTYTTLLNKDFYLEMTQKNNYLYCVYQIR
jgi:hypothetical protein